MKIINLFSRFLNRLFSRTRSCSPVGCRGGFMLDTEEDGLTEKVGGITLDEDDEGLIGVITLIR